ncbi:Swt1 family HEPN domain-containing protein [Pseudomonas fluorescens]|uniref:Swt1 family HEPN domain-containing protein n=1 Tax=Pseudomonas fluorescens TaxID=294 RepID=UPI0012404A72|nr:Swt1 family HEPN domain-containing protein [Pseudomonas fluorescens]
MSEKTKQLLEQQEAMLRKLDIGLPSTKIQKLLSISEMHRPMISASDELTKMVASIQSFAPAQHLLSDISAFTARHAELFRSPLDGQFGMPSYLQSPGLQHMLEKERAARKVYDDTFRMPVLGEIAQFGISQFYKEGFADSILSSLDFHADLQAKMEGMRSPWLNGANVLGSAQAFAEIHALGRLVNGPNPFAQSVSASLRVELGDWRDFEVAAPELLVDPQSRTALYVERGFNTALTDFTDDAFDEGLESAGIREHSVGSVYHAELDEAGLARNQNAFNTLMRFEMQVRHFIAEAMLAQYGEDWIKHQLPGDMLERWRAKAEASIKAGYSPGELIDYADFTDYRMIIERKDNWANVFRAVFTRPEDIRESFQRLFPVRIATMHARIITLDDDLYLRSETQRVLSAIRKATRSRG